MLTKRLKPGQLFTANGKVFRVRNAKLETDCEVCQAINNNNHCIAQTEGFQCIIVCGVRHYPQFIRNVK